MIQSFQVSEVVSTSLTSSLSSLSSSSSSLGEKGLIQFRGQATFVSANFRSHFKAAAVFRFLFGPTDDFEQRRGACGMFSTRAKANKL